MEPKNTPLEKEKHLQNQQLLGSMFFFEGVNIYFELLSIYMHPNSLENLQGTYGYGAGLCPWPSSEP